MVICGLSGGNRRRGYGWLLSVYRDAKCSIQETMHEDVAAADFAREDPFGALVEEGNKGAVTEWE